MHFHIKWLQKNKNDLVYQRIILYLQLLNCPSHVRDLELQRLMLFERSCLPDLAQRNLC